MTNTLKLLVPAAIIGTVYGFANPSFAQSAPAASRCVQVGQQYFMNGNLVDRSRCAPAATAHMKRDTPPAPTHTDQCEGRPKGFTYVGLGPDGKRMAIFTCRG